MLAPVCLFTYNRLSETQQTIEALQKNYLASESELFIFSDGPKNESDKWKVSEVRKYLKTISGFKTITIFESEKNKGLANSIISGVTKMINQYGKVIVLEDDLITSPNFLDFMNQALDFYENNPVIQSISGYTLALPSLKNYHKDYYLGYRASSWGWGTWKKRWNDIDWDAKQYAQFKKNIISQIKFMRGGSDMPRMLRLQMKGKVDSWAIRWCFDQFLKDQLTVFPSVSKVINIGDGVEATHTKNTKRFITLLDSGKKRTYSFDNNILMDKIIIKEFKNKFSLYSRLKDKLNV